MAVDPRTDKPYVVWFVNNTAPAGGDGTFESPFNTLAAAQAASGPYDIIYIYPGSGEIGMNTGFTAQLGQLIFGAGFSYRIGTTKGSMKIPAQAIGLPTVANTLVTGIGISAITLNAGKNTVAGLNLVDNFGGGTGGADVSAGLYIQGGKDYQVLSNTMSTFSAHGGGNCFNIYGGGDLLVWGNTFIGRDIGDTFGVNLLPFVNPIQGVFIFEKNRFTGADVNSGLVRGLDVEATGVGGSSKGIIGIVKFVIVDNIFDSQSNTSGDEPAGITILASPNAGVPVIADMIGNKVTMPAGITQATAGFIISAQTGALGPLIASLHKNVSLTVLPVPGYIFTNHHNPANLQLDMGSDNFGTSTGP